MKIPIVIPGRTACRRHAAKRRGTILIVAMILIFAIAALVLTLGQAMRVEAIVAANSLAAREASAIERGAEQYVVALLLESTDPVEELSESYFQAVQLGAGYFWILRPDYGDASMPPFGLTDESAKINLNYVPYDSLILLPGMTEDVAASIIDWRDEDDTPTAGMGAESQVYLSRTPGHTAKNANFDTVEELRLVERFTAEVLWGDGTAPPLGQTSSAVSDQPFESEAYRVRGFYDLFTVWGKEAQTSLDGETRIDVNQDANRQAIASLFTETFGATRGNELAGRLTNQDVVDIFDWALRLQMTPEELAQVEYRISVGPPSDNPMKVNLNRAPRDVLVALPGQSESNIDALLARRETEVLNDPYSIAWALDVLGPSAFGLGRFVTGRGAVYSADILAVSGNGRAFRRVRIVVDTTPSAGPQIIYRRDITEQGWPMDASLLQSLRSGQGPGMFTGSGR